MIDLCCGSLIIMSKRMHFNLISTIKRLSALICFGIGVNAITKVVIPAVYKEWNSGKPEWMKVKIQEKYNYTTHVYQRLEQRN